MVNPGWIESISVEPVLVAVSGLEPQEFFLHTLTQVRVRSHLQIPVCLTDFRIVHEILQSLCE